jgi:CRISPR-associated endonuclease/helicase Cas3
MGKFRPGALMSPSFDAAFRALTGNDPFPWQRDLYANHFVLGKFPDACTLPTGLGKTSVVAVWLLALAANPTHVPRRLVYVVNRRTVVDQTTAEVEKYRTNLEKLPDLADTAAQLRALCAAETKVPLALSTLRGQFADNRAWSADPSRPAVICGTVDMIGSRLLFSGYGCGFKTRPLHAGFLGQDALLVHDEAHLEKPFQDLVEAIRAEQTRCTEFRPFHVTALTATPRGGENVFRLSVADRADATVRKRLGATKRLHLATLKDAKKPAAELATKALAFKDSGRAVLVFARSVEAVQLIVEALKKDKVEKHVEQLTGTLRGLERDALAASNEAFARFLPPGDRKCKIVDGTVYLVCTSAGEVGVNLSADHLVSDLTPFDSMAQRFGRVNRFGACDDTEIHVLHPPAFDPADALGPACERTLALLRELNGDVSPAALTNLDEKARLAAFTPTPTILPTSDILFDAWALTSVRGRLPGRPPVEPYLHGLAGWEPPETHVAWRREVEVLTEQLRARYDPTELLAAYPLKPHELLRDRTDRVFKQLERLEAPPDTAVWLTDDESDVTVTTLGKVIEAGKDELAGMTVLLPPAAGGLANGLLSGDSTAADDVADRWYADADGTIPRRARVWDEDDAPEGMRSILTVDTQPDNEDDEEEVPRRYWYWFERPKDGDDEGSKSARGAVTWDVHTGDVVGHTTAIAGRLFPSDRLGELLVVAARLHDLGKKRAAFQRVLGNFRPDYWLAKSGKAGGKLAETYRHEFGSLLDAAGGAGFEALGPDERELVLHLIAAHHGRGRPHFPADEAFDPERPVSCATAAAREVPRCFARLQRKYGRWGLAYLESLLRAADYAASASPSAFENGGGP